MFSISFRSTPVLLKTCKRSTRSLYGPSAPHSGSRRPARASRATSTIGSGAGSSGRRSTSRSRNVPGWMLPSATAVISPRSSARSWPNIAEVGVLPAPPLGPITATCRNPSVRGSRAVEIASRSAFSDASDPSRPRRPMPRNRFIGLSRYRERPSAVQAATSCSWAPHQSALAPGSRGESETPIPTHPGGCPRAPRWPAGHHALLRLLPWGPPWPRRTGTAHVRCPRRMSRCCERPAQ